MKNTKLFLEELNKLFPLDRAKFKGNHSLCVLYDEPHQFELCVWLDGGDKWQAIYLDEKDLEKGPAVLAQEIKESINVLED